MINKKISKIFVPLDGSKNSQRGLETAITLARNCGATITGFYSINAQPHSEFKGSPSVEKSLYKEVEKIMEKAKTLAAQNGIVFKDKIALGEIGYNIIKAKKPEIMKNTGIRQLCVHCVRICSHSSISGIIAVDMPKSLNPSAISGI